MKRYSLLLLLAFTLVAIAPDALAQAEKQEECPKGAVKLQVAIGTTTCVGDGDMSALEEYILIFYTYFVGTIGIIAAVMIMYGGYKWIIAAGNSQKIESAKSTIFSAVVGLILTLTSYLILNVLNPATLNSSTKVLEVPKPAEQQRAAETEQKFCENRGAEYEKIRPTASQSEIQSHCNSACTGTSTSRTKYRWSGQLDNLYVTEKGVTVNYFCCDCVVDTTGGGSGGSTPLE